jgi:hypothetical protein
MPPLTRGAKLRRIAAIAAIPRSACDWYGAVFTSKDLGPLVLASIEDLEDIVSYAKTCVMLHISTIDILGKVRNLVRECDNDPEQLARFACIMGDMRLYEYCIRQGAEVGEGCAEAAIAGGHISILRRMHFVDANYKLGVQDMAWAAHRGQLHILKWLKELGIQWDEHAFVNAAVAGQTDCLKFILDKGFIFKAGETFAGSRDSFIDLDEVDWPIRCTDAVEFAAENGHIDCVQLIKETCPSAQLTVRAANKAAGNGHLHMLEWMWPKMNAWAADIGMYAIEGDHVACFQFVYEKLRDTFEVPIRWQLMFEAAALLGKPKCLRYMLGTSMFVITPDIRHQMLTRPAAEGQECLRACAEGGVTFAAEDLTKATCGTDLGIVTMLAQELKVPWETDALVKLVLSDHVSPAMFAHCLVLGAPTPENFVTTLCIRGKDELLERFIKARNPVFKDIQMHACVRHNQPLCAIALINHHGNREQMRTFVPWLYGHTFMKRARPNQQAFMNSVFES